MLASRQKPNQARSLYLGKERRTAVVASFENIAIASVHLSWEIHKLKSRAQQISELLRELPSASGVIVMGDFNCLPWQKPRQLLIDAGFSSVIAEIAPDRSTAPTAAYQKDVFWYFRLFAKRGFSVDDIYYRGLELQSGGLFEGPSDHRGIWAEFQHNKEITTEYSGVKRYNVHAIG